MRSLPLALALPFLLSCTGDDGDDIDVDSHAVCDCPDLTAADIAYDNLASGLAGGDVQDAVDELAARPQGLSDAYERVVIEESTTTSSSSGTGHTITVGCPGTAPNVAVALGGSCRGGSTGVSIQSTHLQSTGFTCIWNKPEGEAVEFTATVSCLSKAVAE